MGGSITLGVKKKKVAPTEGKNKGWLLARPGEATKHQTGWKKLTTGYCSGIGTVLQHVRLNTVHPGLILGQRNPIKRRKKRKGVGRGPSGTGKQENQ